MVIFTLMTTRFHRTSWAFMENLGLGGSAGLFNDV